MQLLHPPVDVDLNSFDHHGDLMLLPTLDHQGDLMLLPTLDHQGDLMLLPTLGIPFTHLISLQCTHCSPCIINPRYPWSPHS